MTAIKLILSGVLAAVSLTAAAQAQQPASEAPIRIDSKTTEYLQNEGRGVYTGDVVVTQGDARITTDKLTLVCTKSAPSANGNKDCGDIDQIIADGKVLYTAPDAKIRGDRAVYQVSAGIVTITGADVIVTRGDDGVMRGTEAVYNVDEGKVRITAGADRVTTLITPKKKDGAAQPAAPATPPN